MTFIRRLTSSTMVAIGATIALHGALATPVDTLTATGLLPVHDSSGETHGELFAWHMTPAIYEAMEDAGGELVLLNPGGAYSPLDEVGTLEFARTARVRTVLMPRLAPTLRSGPKDNSPTLRVEVKVLDVENGATLHAFSMTEDVARKDLDRGFDFGPGAHDTRFLWIPGTRVRATHRVSRKIEKQALGKVIWRFAESVRDNILNFKSGVLVYPSAALHLGVQSKSCDVDFTVRYVRQRANSKTFTVVVNGRDESATINNDGVAQFKVPAGLNLFEVAVKDAPYRLPIQREYDINRWMDCTLDERHIVLEIESAGEALIVARAS